MTCAVDLMTVGPTIMPEQPGPERPRAAAPVALADDDLPDVATALFGVRVEHLLTFAVLADELHFTRAAQRLFLSQSGVSRRVLLLERCLGVSLIDRSGRRVVLTSAGRQLLPHAVAVLQHLSAAGSALGRSCDRVIELP